MRRGNGLRLLALMGLLSPVVWSLAADAQTPARPGPAASSLEKTLARDAKVKEADVASVLRVLAPAVRAQLRAGGTVTLPGLGQLRIVRVDAHMDLIKGVPGTVPAKTFVQFLPTADLANEVNSPGAVPGITVPPNEFVTDPRQTPAVKAEYLRTPRSRAGR